MTRLIVIVPSVLLAMNAWAGDLLVSGAWIRSLPGGGPAAGYFVVQNAGQKPAVLLGASSPAFDTVMMHRTVEKGGVSQMLHTEKLELPPGARVAFAPGGYHLMLMAPKRPLSAGDRIPITLQLSDGTTLTVEFDVRGPSGK